MIKRLRLAINEGQAAAEYAERRFEIKFAADLHLWFSPHPADLGYYDEVLIVGTSDGVGAAFCPHHNKHKMPPSVMGQDSRELSSNHVCLEIASLDAAFGSRSVKADPALEVLAEGDSSSRSDVRSKLIADELDRLGVRSVVMVGAVGSVLQAVKSRGIAVSAVDMDKSVVGKELGGVKVLEASTGMRLIEENEAAIVTGMTLTTETIDDVFDMATASNTRLVMFSQTGSNF